MTSLLKLYFVKGRAKLRNIFSSPGSAIITVVVLLMYLGGFVPMILGSGGEPLTTGTMNIIALTVLGFSLFLALTVMVSEAKSFFFVEDAYFIFTSPYTNRQILGYLVIDLFVTGITMGLMSMLGMLMFQSYRLSLTLILLCFLASSAMQVIFTTVTYWLYLRNMISGSMKKRSLVMPIVIVTCLLAAFGYEWLNGGQNVSSALNAMLTGNTLNYIPVAGWARMGVVGVMHGDGLMAATGWGLLALGIVIPGYLFVSTKGDFYEQAVMDAEKITEYYRKAKSGNVDATVKKVKASRVEFGRNARAIMSKNLLIVKKRGGFLRLRELGIVAVYLIMCRLMGLGFGTFMIMLLFYQFGTLGTSLFMEDLRHHYIYLIPGKPLAKLVCSLAIPMLQAMAVVGLALAVGGLALGEGLVFTLLAVPAGCSFVILFSAGYTFSLRIMGSRNNVMVDQLLRMLLVLLALIPTGAVIYGLYLLAGQAALAAAVVMPVMAVVNVLVGTAFLALCAPMLKSPALL